MPSYTLELELFSSYVTDVPEFEIWADGVLLGSSYSVTSGGFGISVSPSFSGALPSSLEFRFNDASAEVPRTIEIRSVQINNQYVNTGNYLSSSSLTNGGSSTVDIASVDTNDSDFLFDDSDPLASEFTTGATETFTAGNDTYRRFNDSDDEVFDMLAGRDVAYLGSGNDKVNGGAGNDIIRGGAGNDLLYGGADNDRIFGGNDNDTIYGGTGNDRLHGQDGNDEIHGGDGDDRLNGHAGDDVITGGIGADKLNGGAGVDFLFGGNGNDQLVGGTNNDTIDGGDGDDIAYGGAGIDNINGGDGIDILVGNMGNDIIHGDDGNDVIYGMEDNDTLFGGNGDDYVNGGLGADTLNGGIGADILTGGEGADIVNGGAGDDTIHGHGLTQQQIHTILNANPSVVYNADTNSFYQVVGGGFTHTAATVNANAATLGGVTGNLANITTALEQTYIESIIRGNSWIGGNDTDIEGRWIWMGGAEAGAQFSQDTTVVNGFYENWNGSATDPSLQGVIIRNSDKTWFDRDITSPNDYIIEWNAGLIFDDNAIDTIDGGDGHDTLYGYGGNDVLNGSRGNDLIFGGTGNDIINGGNGVDILYGGDGNDLITDSGSSTSADQIYGGTGADTINAGLADDSIFLANGDFVSTESINGGGGIDALILTNATIVDFTTGVITGLETLTGSAGDQDVKIEIRQLGQFVTVDLGGHTAGDTIRTQIDGVYDAVVDGVPTVTNVENGFLVGSTNADTLTVSDTELSNLIYGTGTINMGDNTDILNLTETSVTLNMLGTTNTSIIGLETISANAAAAGVIIDMSGQTEDFTITGSGNNDTLTTGDGDDTIDGGAGNDLITAGVGADTINGGIGNDTIFAAENVTSEILNVDFDTSLDGFVYVDDIFLDSNQPAFADGSRATTDGGVANGALEVTLGGVNGDDVGPVSGAFQQNLVLASGFADVLVTFSYRALNSGGAPFEANEDLFLFASIAGAAGKTFLTNTTDNFFDSENNPNAGFDTGAAYQTVTFNIGALAAGSHVLSLGGALSFRTEAGEEVDIRFDDLIITGTAVGDAGVTNILNGGAGNDIINAGDGDDTIDGGDNDDTIDGFGGDDTIDGGSGIDEIRGGTGNDTLRGGNGNDIIYGVDANNSALSNANGILFSDLLGASFDLDTEGFVYADGVFGSDGAASDAVADGSFTSVDGNPIGSGNGALEIILGGGGGGVNNISGAFQETINFATAQTNVVLNFSYRVIDNLIDGDPFDADEDLQLFADVDGTTFSNDANPYFFEILGPTAGNNFDSGWVDIALTVGNLTAGNHTLSLGGNLSRKTFNSEQFAIRFDDVNLTSDTSGVVSGGNTGTTNMLYGEDGLDTLFGSTETDVFVFQAATAFNDIDIIENFNVSELDALDISDIITGFSGDITEYARFVDSGTNSLLQVDANGTAGGAVFTTIAQINDLNGLDAAVLLSVNNIII
jgi:Ca2+-binding RTX toxin-like protein